MVVPNRVTPVMAVLPIQMAVMRDRLTVQEAVEAEQVIPDAALDARLSLEGDI